ncbi:hypothetical protein ACH42_00800 [Endozoicomonas sp. (ex Bugula neritina AB1)]|nr:hypothetical protein ACH42_00800 [Endozoicomonas sp. (ex Bugula neritina AB1)]
MYYRSVLFLVILMAIGLLGCQPRFAPESVSYLDDSVVLNLLEQMKQAIRAGDKLRWEGLFVQDAVIEYITPEGVHVINQLEDIVKVMDEYMKFGRGFDIQILSQLVIVSDDGQSAVVERVSKELWLFDEQYEDVSSEIEHYMEWKLVNGVPLIRKMVRKYHYRSALSETGKGSIAPM